MVYVFFNKPTSSINDDYYYLGYRLFVKGLYQNSGEIEGAWKDFKIVVRKATAGTYLVLFGSIVISFTIYKGFTVDETRSNKSDAPKIQNLSLDSIKVFSDSLKAR